MIRIERLLPGDAEAVGKILDEPGDDAAHFFDALPKETEALRSLLASTREDGYWALRVEGEMVGIFMLRGFDEGYASPAFGVSIASAFRGKGLGRLALQYAETWCRLKDVETLMLTVAEDNRRAMALYESFAFVRTGEQSAKGNLIFRKRLAR